MKKPSQKLILTAAAAVAVTVIAVITVIILVNSPKKATKEILEASVDECIEFVKLPDEKAPNYIGVLEERVSVTVKEFTSDGDTATATVTVTAPDLYTTVMELNSRKDVTVDEIDRLLSEMLAKAEMLKTELTLDFYLDGDGEWTPFLTEEFLDAYYGGFLRLRDEAYNEVFKDKEVAEND